MTVIPATSGAAAPITGATVVITGDRISAIGPAASIVIPKQARIVDGSGKFLMPGLIEMHAHASKARASSLGLFVANGVTTIRDMGGDHDELLRWRREIRAGSRVGPRMFIAGPYLEAASRVERMRKDPPSERVEPFERLRIPIGSPDDARRVIGELAKKEVDYIKIRTVQDNDTYLALNEAAHANKLRLTGHVPTGMDPEFVLKAGQDDIEHGFFPPLKIASRDERLALWRKFAARGVVVVPTMVVIKKSVLVPVDHLKAMMEDAAGKIEPRRPYVSLFCLKDWREQLSETTPARQKAYRGDRGEHAARLPGDARSRRRAAGRIRRRGDQHLSGLDAARRTGAVRQRAEDDAIGSDRARHAPVREVARHRGRNGDGGAGEDRGPDAARRQSAATTSATPGASPRSSCAARSTIAPGSTGCSRR